MKVRKKSLALLSMLGTALFSCNTEELESRIARLNAQNQELTAQYQAKDSSLTAFMTSFAEIKENLSEIRSREMNIEVARGQNISTDDHKDLINQNVSEINRLLEENREKINELNARLKYAGRQNNRLKVSLEELQQTLTAKIDEKEKHIVNLKNELKGL